MLFGQWGFSKDRAAEVQGTGVIFYGPPGCGKSMAAKAIGYECGRPLKVVNSAELVSKVRVCRPARLPAADRRSLVASTKS